MGNKRRFNQERICTISKREKEEKRRRARRRKRRKKEESDNMKVGECESILSSSYL